jgi:toxin ParE1/3/4
MPNRYIYSRRAVRQVKKIYLDTAKEWGLAQADKYDEGLEHTLQLLADNPSMGRECNEIRKGYHQHEYGRHIIFYRQRKSDVFITAIIYDSMNLKRIFSSRDNS